MLKSNHCTDFRVKETYITQVESEIELSEFFMQVQVLEDMIRRLLKSDCINDGSMIQYVPSLLIDFISL